MRTGRPLAAPATPPRGGDTPHVIRSGAGSATPGSGSRGDPAPAPGSGAEPAAPAWGCRSWRRRASLSAPRSRLSRRSRAARRAAGAEERVSGRGASATDTCLQGSARRAPRSERVRLLPAGWAAARAAPSRLLLPLLLSLRSPAPAGPGTEPGSLRHRPRTWPPRRALSARLPAAPVPPPGSRQQLQPRNTPAPSSDSGGPRTPHGEVTLPGLPGTSSCPPSGARGRAASGFSAAREWGGRGAW